MTPEAAGPVRSIVSQINRDPVNAVIASFDFATNLFTVTRDVPGGKVTVQGA